MIGAPDALEPLCDLRGSRIRAAIERLAVEGIGGAELRRVAARVEVLSVGRAVDVDHVARELRAHHGRIERAEEIVEARQVPVGIGPAHRAVVERAADAARNERPGMRHRNNEGAAPVSIPVRPDGSFREEQSVIPAQAGTQSSERQAQIASPLRWPSRIPRRHGAPRPARDRSRARVRYGVRPRAFRRRR